MNQPKVDVTQLIQRDPTTWTALLRRREGMEGVQVTAVTSQHIYNIANHDPYANLIRYSLHLADHNDPITCIGKRTNQVEALFYQEMAAHVPLSPTCWFARTYDDKGWIVIDDVPNHFPPEKWTPDHAQNIIQEIAGLHATFWNQSGRLQAYKWLPHFIGREEKTYTWKELRQEQAFYFEEGPASAISEHAISHVGRLAPIFVQAANGLTVLRDLGGWPGILGESHLAAAADLLDDPVPMLDTLTNLPLTFLHGNIHNYHWRVTLFDDHCLVDWQKCCIGPGVFDLVEFAERFDLLYMSNQRWPMLIRSEPLLTEETMIDSYLLAMRSRLGDQFDARSARQAIPAARCLHVLTTWFPHFSNWFTSMPNKYVWQRINRLQDEQLVGSRFEPIIGFRPFLAGVFMRFLQAYHTL